MSFIPKIIHLTHYDYDCIPEKVWINLNKFAFDYKITYYSDQECFDFIELHFNIEIANIFSQLSTGAHKADLFRYCIIYILGGIYLDIKVVPYKNFNNIFDHNRSNLMYTVLDKKNKGIFQGIIASYPKNQFFKELIDDFLNLDPAYFNIKMTLSNPKYYYFCTRFFNNIQKKINSKVQQGELYYSNQIIFLFKETNVRLGVENKDKYGGYFNVFNNSYERIFKIRYSDFPWKKIERNILNIGSSKKNTKIINFDQPKIPTFNLLFISDFSDTFETQIIDNTLNITRTDLPTGWNQKLKGYLYKDKIKIGNSNSNTKVLHLNQKFPKNTELIFGYNNNYPDTFFYTFLEDNKLIITRTDIKEGWGQDLVAYVSMDCIKIGSSLFNQKVIQLHRDYSPDTKLCFIHSYKDTFSYSFKDRYLTIIRTDKQEGWGQFLVGYIV